jgi:hypothetical protein
MATISGVYVLRKQVCTSAHAMSTAVFENSVLVLRLRRPLPASDLAGCGKPSAFRDGLCFVGHRHHGNHGARLRLVLTQADDDAALASLFQRKTQLSRSAAFATNKISD